MTNLSPQKFVYAGAILKIIKEHNEAAMRKLYLVCYDISDNKVYRKVHELVKGYAVGGQKSCFECWLSDTEKLYLALLIEKLYAGTTERADFFELSQDSNAGYFGIAEKNKFNPFFIF